MQSFGNEIKIQQGENWNLDKRLSASNREYVPYIISSARRNPYFVVTVASTKFEKNKRYVASWWNKPTNNAGENLPTFISTVPIEVPSDINKNDIYDDPGNYRPYDLPGDVGQYETYKSRYLYRITFLQDNIDPETGHKPYHYLYFIYEDNEVDGCKVDEYDCRIRFNFDSEITGEWYGQNYMYAITLVEGPLLDEHLENIAKTKNNNVLPSDWPDTTEAQYDYVKIKWPDALQEDIDVTSPLGKIEHPETILEPTRLEVFNNLRKLI